MFENSNPLVLLLLVILVVVLIAMIVSKKKSKSGSLGVIGSHEYDGGYDEENESEVE